MIISERRCEVCRFCHRENLRDGSIELSCRKNPPTGYPVFNQSRQGTQLVGTVAVFPVVQPTAFCHQFEKGLLQ